MNNYNAVPDTLRGLIEDYITESSSNGDTKAVKYLLEAIKEAVQDMSHYYKVCKHTTDMYLDDLEGQDSNPASNLVKLRYDEVVEGLAPDEC